MAEENSIEHVKCLIIGSGPGLDIRRQFMLREPT